MNREKKPIEELTPLEICLEYLKHADENGSEYVDALIRQGGKELQMAQVILRKATEDEILGEQAIAREKFENDMISMKCHMREAEEARDKMQRRLQEAEHNLRKTAAELKARGMSAEEISDITGLSAEEIEKKEEKS